MTGKKAICGSISTAESLTTLREKLVKIGAKVVRQAKDVTFQMAEVTVPRKLFQAILRRIAKFRLAGPRGSPA